ncbi:MAG TPA: hypothetical protein IGS17_13250 [Oscillatoriales cyanobacterium M59_W2019_021]|nr:MAG: hypothetical protein D6728_16775 [Cyanobacteria bacterium J055]HIK32769.1 hypothetical protein [Oscillatoriales cyanobacterium M4454_W2019_049]HIK51871.1 hypothetical protein [Oscillatoriales cyanobacterium M59_W2019_021]
MSKSPNKKQILKAIEQLKKNPNNKASILADAGITLLGAAGIGAVAAIAGTTTASIPVITTLTGVGLVVAAPVGLVAGAAVAGGAVAFGLSRLIKGKGYDEGKQSQLLEQLQEQLREIERKEKTSSLKDGDKTQFIIFLEEPLQHDLMIAKDANDLIQAVENGHISLKEAYQYIIDLLNESKALAKPSLILKK